MADLVHRVAFPAGSPSWSCWIRRIVPGTVFVPAPPRLDQPKTVSRGQPGQRPHRSTSAAPPRRCRWPTSRPAAASWVPSGIGIHGSLPGGDVSEHWQGFLWADGFRSVSCRRSHGLRSTRSSWLLLSCLRRMRTARDTCMPQVLCLHHWPAARVDDTSGRPILSVDQRPAKIQGDVITTNGPPASFHHAEVIALRGRLLPITPRTHRRYPAQQKSRTRIPALKPFTLRLPEPS